MMQSIELQPVGGGVLSSWIQKKTANKDELHALPEAFKKYNKNDLAGRILRIIDSMSEMTTKSIKDRQEMVIADERSSWTYNGIRVWMYRPRRIYVPARHVDFQDDHIFICIDWSGKHALVEEFAKKLVENLRTDELFANAGDGHISLDARKGKVHTYAGAVKMWSDKSSKAHPVNVEVFCSQLHFLQENNQWARFDHNKQLPGGSEMAVKLQIGPVRYPGRFGESLDCNAAYQVKRPGDMEWLSTRVDQYSGVRIV